MLQIFPKHPTTDAYYVNGSYTPWAVVGLDKRFSDAELAAEYWQADYADVRYDREDEDLDPIPEIIHRFAQLPHFDE